MMGGGLIDIVNHKSRFDPNALVEREKKAAARLIYWPSLSVLRPLSLTLSL